MARKKKLFPPPKENLIGFRVTNELYEIIANEAALAKLSVSEYCRTVILNKKITFKKEMVFNSPELLSALSNLGRIGNSLNQIARHSNEGGSWNASMKKDIQQCVAELRQIREDIKEMAGEYRGDC